MDRGESRRTGDRLLPGDTCARGAPPDALPVIRFESSDEEGISSEPEGRSKARRSSDPQEHTEGAMMKKFSRSRASLQRLTRRFLQLMQEAPGCCVDLSSASTRLRTKRRRLYDITNALYGVQVIEKESRNKVRWIGKSPISVFLLNKKKELEKLRQMEATLDGLIRRCAQQLFDLTDDDRHSAWAYVTHQDLGLLQTFQEQTVIAVRAPEETKMEVPVPTEDSVQIHLKATQGPITVLSCEPGPGRTAEATACFLALEESRIRTNVHAPDRGSSAQDSW
ncbi:unnamed protein product [Tetraodon nigroviridis]|uniref:(spotted green pufferfish) hypothetical protein n=1 Tax=Tetraodon nigroviridis TaxID=99883 RepID=Q4SWM7_TETNG|nr:unnamed protein product [Tetraodon nigroviridis]